MSRFKIINLIDKLFVSLAIFLLVYAWINFYIRDLFTTFIVSLIISFALIFILYYFLGKKDLKRNLSKEKKEKFFNTILAFKLLPAKEKEKIVFEIIEKENATLLNKSKLIFLKDEKKHKVIFAMNIDRITENDLINIISDNTFEKFDYIDIICNDYVKNIRTSLMKETRIRLITTNVFYTDFIEKYGIVIDTSILDKSATKLKFKDILNGILAPHKSKSYFLCGLILIFSSIILPYHVYYLIFGTIFMLFSILSKILPKFKNR